LLGSYCIFASAVVAQGDDAISARLRRVTQIALAVTVLSTFSRAILGFALAVMIRNARTPSLRAVAIAATAICVGLIALLTFTRVSLDPSRPFDTELSTATDSVREQELKASVDTLREHPIFGTGPGSLPGEAVGYGPRDAHNTPVGVAATLGLPALGALLALFLVLWWRRSRPTNKATWGGLAGLAIQGLGHDVENFRHVWVMIGMAGSTPGTGGRRKRAPLGGAAHASATSDDRKLAS
jgi:O-antigen ligase